ncbi:hypothetical protein HY572_06140 [Candidatus Micrarchaeota archaeon]|nr:hypothetical protein [Candidatus Micrarchaeota archaeon]
MTRFVAYVAALTVVLALGLFLAPQLVAFAAGGLAPEQMPPAIFMAFAALGGLVAFFNPCSLAAFPAMVSLVFNAQKPQAPFWALAAFAATGLAAFYALALGVLWLFGSALAGFLVNTRILAGLALAVLAVFLWFDVPLARYLPAPRLMPAGRPRGFFSIGFFYGLTGAFCTTPVLLALFVFPLATGVQTVAPAFFFFVLVSALAMFAATYLALEARQSLPNTPSFIRILRGLSSLVLALAAAYLLFPYLPQAT